jgi:multidrug resistance efflux pump
MKNLFVTASLFFLTLFSATAQTSENVSDADLEEFAQAYQSVQQSNQQIQQKMVAAIEDEGISADRFNAIYEAKMNPEKEVDATDDEMEKQEAAMAKVEAMQQSFQKEMEDKIKEKGFTMQQFQDLATKIQNSPELRQKMQAIMMKGQTGNQPMENN